ncbi:single-stranded DNA-binding protein [Enterococcus gallinarum]|uniref:single-stranded DNA-binding protein n=1 Tax=Enterococcus gallinarum TaxID=1353 RepID=UPI00249747B3|nr:single-stranded DNA-binding protein [Enterococcus gallinarum]GMG59868.1 single-stranded DNA-binding protein [Enterococcus gallinarum]
MINNVTLVGRLTKDPDLRYTPNGTGVASFTLAVNRNFTNQTGERGADFINCVIWRKPAETLANYARKGTLLGLTGRIQTRSYDNQQGQRVYVTEVVADNFQLLESKATSEQRRQNESQASNRNAYNQPNPDNFPSETDMPRSSSIDISDDDLPF